MTNQSELRNKISAYLLGRNMEADVTKHTDMLLPLIETLINAEVSKALEEVKNEWPTGYMNTETEHFYAILDDAIAARKGK